MTGSDDSGVVLSASDEQNEPSEISESEKVPTMTSDDVVESRSDATPTKLDESSAAPAPEMKDDKSQSEDASVAEASPDDKGKASIKSEHNDNDVSDADKEDLSDGTDVDEYLERYRSKYDNMTARIKLAPKRVKQTHQYTSILDKDFHSWRIEPWLLTRNCAE